MSGGFDGQPSQPQMTVGEVGEGRVEFISKALLVAGWVSGGCYGVAMETRRRERWFMMDADGWSTPEVIKRGDMHVCTCVYLNM